MRPIIFSFPGNEQFSEQIIRSGKAEEGKFLLHQFPDGEDYVRIVSEVKDKDVIIFCSLQEPSTKILPLFFFCRLLKDQNVRSIRLVAPYLAYMRQDIAFNKGEAVTSGYFAAFLSSFVDHLITVDPHLHRIKDLNEVYTIPCDVIHASSIITEWIRVNIPDALLVGPDSESKQWVSAVAGTAGVPYIVLEKKRSGDEDVQVSVPDVDKFKDRTPVLIDDIISTAHTMIETISHLKRAGMRPPVCIGVHAVFAGNAYDDLGKAGAGEIITCNTIRHVTNRIDVSGLLTESIFYKGNK